MNASRISLVITAVLSLQLVLGMSARAEEREEKGFVVRPVTVFEAVRTTLEEKLLTMGNVKGWREVDVFPKVPGKLKKYMVRLQQVVRRDQPIALIDQDLTGVKYQPAVIKAPIDGIVAIMYLDEGEVVNPPTMSRTMGTPVARIVDMRKVRIQMRIPDVHITDLSRGMPVEILPDGSRKWLRRGRLTKIEPVIDIATRTFGVEALVPNADRALIPGMFVKVRIITEIKKNAIAVHKDAIVKRGDDSFVMVVKDGVVEARKVTTGIQDNLLIEITSGVKEGELVILSGPSLFHTGDHVNVVEKKSLNDSPIEKEGR